MKKLLSVVTPFYCSSEENYLNERIDLYIQESYKPDWMERIIVDFGSPTRIAKRVQKLCEKYSFKYCYRDISSNTYTIRIVLFTQLYNTNTCFNGS